MHQKVEDVDRLYQIARYQHLQLFPDMRLGDKRRKAKGGYLFNHKALAKVFRAKLLAGIEAGPADQMRCQ